MFKKIELSSWCHEFVRENLEPMIPDKNTTNFLCIKKEHPISTESYVMYCTVCKEVHTVLADYDITRKDWSDVILARAFMCSNCKNVVNANNVGFLEKEGSFVLRERVFTSEDKVTLSISKIILSEYCGYVRRGLINYNFSFNARSGQSYRLPPMKNGKQAKSLRNIKQIRHPVNISYGFGMSSIDTVSKETLTKMAEEIYKRKIENGIYAIDPKNIDFNNLADLAFYNKMPVVQPQSFINLVTLTKNYNMRSRYIYNERATDHAERKTLQTLRAITKHKDGSVNNYVPNILETFGIRKCKTFNKAVAHDIGIAVFIRGMLDIGFNSVDIIGSTVMEMSAIEFRHISKEHVAILIREIIKRYGERHAAKIIIDSWGALEDSSKMYKELALKGAQGCIEWSRDIYTLHDNLTVTYNKLANKNIVFDIEEDKKRLNGIINSYRFRVAECSYDLLEAGSKLKICVYSYSYSVASRETDIVIVYQNEKPIACIEIKQNRIVQAKTSCNMLPEGAIYNAIIKWAEINNLKIDTTDLIKEGC